MKCIVAVVLLLACGLAAGQIHDKGWWKNAVFYQVYPRSFMDSNNDGNGDIPGIRNKLDHFKELGITAIWLSPINESPMKDAGYDISDFKDINGMFGTLDDVRKLIEEAHKQGLKVILDLVPNHTSDNHYWFQKSVDSIGKYKDYYIWSDGKNGKPPNNWVSVFNNSAWTYNEKRKQYYFHQFLKEQPDLNYRNEDVKKEMLEIIRFWLDIGMDGFRIDAVPHLFEHKDLTLNETLINPGLNESEHANFNHIYTKDQQETYDLIKSWRKFVDDYANQNNRTEIVLLTEAYTSWNMTLKYYNYGSHVPFNFKFITDVNKNSNAAEFKNIIDKWTAEMPEGSVANWVMGNHDRVRLASRYPKREDHMVMLEMILPGVAVTYYGEEIGMEDNVTLHTYDFRDGCRTPFQWDNSTNAGFNKGKQTWLPVHTKYTSVNLENEKKASNSHYIMYVQLIKLRKRPVLINGSLETKSLNNDTVLLVQRNVDNETATLLLNFVDKPAQVDLTKYISRPTTKIALTNVEYGAIPNGSIALDKFTIPKQGSVILLSSGASAIGLSIMTALFLLFTSLLR